MHEDKCACCAQDPETVLANDDRMIEQYGFMYQAVSSGGNDDSPGFMYTIGLAERGLPEFIFIGGSNAAASGYLRGAIETAMAGGAIEPGLVAPETGINAYAVPMWVLRADHRLQTHAFGVAARLERAGSTATPRLFQIVMPDLSGRFPWEKGYVWMDQQVETPPATGTC